MGVAVGFTTIMGFFNGRFALYLDLACIDYCFELALIPSHAFIPTRFYPEG